LALLERKQAAEASAMGESITVSAGVFVDDEGESVGDVGFRHFSI
jgi:hypothetical protein